MYRGWAGSAAGCPACTCAPGNYCLSASTAATGVSCPAGSYCAGGVAVPVACSTSATVAASGGTTSYSGVYTLHTFTASGTFTLPVAVVGAQVQVLVIGGGGGAGGALGAGGGGGGAVPQTISGISAPYSVSVTVGAGGAGTTGAFFVRACSDERCLRCDVAVVCVVQRVFRQRFLSKQGMLRVPLAERAFLGL